MDQWYGLTIDDIRAIEDKTKQELDRVSGLLCVCVVCMCTCVCICICIRVCVYVCIVWYVCMQYPGSSCNNNCMHISLLYFCFIVCYSKDMKEKLKA